MTDPSLAPAVPVPTRPVPRRLRLGLNLGYWGTGDPAGDDGDLALAQEADRLGYAVVWAAEAYGSDAVTVLAWVAARTTRIDVGSAVLQIPARSATMTAMTAATLDTLSGGRFRLGLGVSGPQVSEGWHGVRFTDPLGRTREYLDVVRMALRRETVRYGGHHLRLPLPDGPGKAMRLTVHPVRPQVPVYLAAVGPKNLALAGQVADGWLGIFFSPEQAALSLDPLRAGRLAAGQPADHGVGQAATDPAAAPDPLTGFDVSVTVPVAIDDDVAAAADRLRAYYALYLGGMGSRERNFYHRLAARMGYQAEADVVQGLYLDRRPREAAVAVPLDLIDATALIGPRSRIRDRLARYPEAGVTTVNVGVFDPTAGQRLATVRTMAEILDESNLGA